MWTVPIYWGFLMKIICKKKEEKNVFINDEFVRKQNYVGLFFTCMWECLECYSFGACDSRGYRISLSFIKRSQNENEAPKCWAFGVRSLLPVSTSSTSGEQADKFIINSDASSSKFVFRKKKVLILVTYAFLPHIYFILLLFPLPEIFQSAAALASFCFPTFLHF